MESLNPIESPRQPESDAGRATIVGWQEARPRSFFDADPGLAQSLELYWGAEHAAARGRLSAFGVECATALNDAVIVSNRDENLPRLERYSPQGERIENVVFHPSYHEAGRMIYGSGIMASHAEPGRELERMALFYLSSQNGEAGHNCPLACTAGIIKSLQRIGTLELAERYLPRLLNPDYRELIHGAQYMTEVQGGSDVGANGCKAVPDPEHPGEWRIWGEKWFCSNVTAELAVMTARPEGKGSGTGGLGLFLVPRHLDDGSVNGMKIRRLKYKLGTRSMASGELDFEGARAWALGPVEHGFRNMMEIVISTSRLYNSVSVTGLARRAFFEAQTYATHRRAFGGPILRFPLVRQALARMKAELAAMVAGCFYLADLDDRTEAGQTDENAAHFRRLMLNLMKTFTAKAAHRIIQEAIGIFGGNGAIEEFSVLPRLLRDCVVCENWEGTHHVLLSQVLRDLGRFEQAQAYGKTMAAMIKSLGGSAAGDACIARLAPVLDALPAELSTLAGLPADLAALSSPPLFERMNALFMATCLAREVVRFCDPIKSAAFDEFTDLFLPTAQTEINAARAARFELLSATL